MRKIKAKILEFFSTLPKKEMRVEDLEYTTTKEPAYTPAKAFSKEIGTDVSGIFIEESNTVLVAFIESWTNSPNLQDITIQISQGEVTRYYHPIEGYQYGFVHDKDVLHAMDKGVGWEFVAIQNQ